MRSEIQIIDKCPSETLDTFVLTTFLSIDIIEMKVEIRWSINQRF